MSKVNIDGVEVVNCPGCKQDLAYDKFWKNSSTYNGLQTYCKECHRVKTKSFNDRNPGMNSKYVRAYEAENPDKVAMWRKNYAKRHKQRMAEDPVYANMKRAEWRTYYQDVIKPRKLAAKLAAKEVAVNG